MKRENITALGVAEDAADALIELFDRELDGVRSERDGLKEELERARAGFEADMLRRDQEEWLKKQFDTFGVRSLYARKQLAGDCISGKAGLAWENGGFSGFAGFMESAEKQDPALICDPKPANGGTGPAFTAPLSAAEQPDGAEFGTSVII